jgi:putative copper export protein
VTAAAGPDLAPALDGIRLILHVLAATIWVGGQFTVTGLLPTVRRLGDDAPKQVARALARLLWPAYAVLVVTGFWNMAAVHANNGGSAYQVVLGIKIGVVALAGLGVWLHQRATSRRGLAIWGSVGGTASIAALCLGVFLAG